MTRSVVSTRTRTGAPARASGWPEVLLVVLSALLYSVLCSLAPVEPRTAFAHARHVIAVERWLGLDIELPINHWLHAHPVIASAASTFYSLSFFLVTLLALALVWRRRPDRYEHARNSLFLMTGAAMATYWIYPLAPPRLMPELGFVDAVAADSAIGAGYTHASAALANPYAAMPSMHTGWAVWTAVVLSLFIFTAPWQRLLLALHPIATVWTIIATANHFVLDAVAGTTYFAIAFVASWMLIARATASESATHADTDRTDSDCAIG